MSNIIRAKRNYDFTIINNNVVRDNILSLEARGLLTTILSYPDDWAINTAHLATITYGTRKHSRINAIWNILKELRDTGFMRMKKHADGTVSYTVYDTQQQDEAEKPNSQNTSQEKPDSQNPSEAFTSVLLSTNKLLNTNKLLINENSSVDNENLTATSSQKTPLPANFCVTDEMRAWYAEQGFALDIDVATQEWKVFVTSKKYQFPDWCVAWKNGITRTNSMSRQKPAQATKQAPQPTYQTTYQPAAATSSAEEARKKLNTLCAQISAVKADVAMWESRNEPTLAETPRKKLRELEEKAKLIAESAGIKLAGSEEQKRFSRSVPADVVDQRVSAIHAFTQAFKRN